MRLLLACLAAIIATPAWADDTLVEVINHSSLVVSSVSGFPLDEAGNFIEDNLGGLYEDVAPGATAIATFAGRCGPTLAVVVLANGSDLRTNLNTCKVAAIVVSDQPKPQD